MNFKKLKRISPAHKIYACIAVIASFLIFTFLHLQILDSRLSESIAKHDLASKLLQQAQNLPFNAELILREVPKSKDYLEKNLNLYEKHFYTLKGGGVLYYDGVVSALTASDSHSKESFQELETLWFEFKANGEVLLNQETFIGGSEMATGIIDEFGNYIAEEVFKSVTPEVRMSIEFIEGNSQLFLDLNYKIVELFENEVKVLLRAKRIATYIDSTLLLFLVFILMYLFRSAYFQNIQRLRNFAEEVSSGNIDILIKDKVGGELGRIWNAFEAILGTFKNAVQFIERIGSGDLKTDYELKGDEDDFGRSLIHMKERMIQTEAENKKRKVEDDIRSWTTQGIAKFGELLRQNNSNINELSYSVISELIEYVGANQGGVFVLEEDYKGRYFSLVASYAYNRRKYLEKRIAWGDTLIGRCALEQKTLHLKEVPEDYLEISSGLGNYRPASLLLCPLKFNDDIYGVVELASFSALEPHHISFVEKISESIASTISSVRINSKTSQLLEESKEQAERLSQQEEEMRQNMEEMQATQEEAAIRNSQLEGIINAIDNTLGTFELDLDGKYVNANSNYLKSIKSDIDTLLIQNHRDVVAQFSENLEGYDELMKTIINGGTVKRVFQYQLEQEMLYFLESFTPVIDSYDNITKVIVFATNITENKQNELAVQSSLDRVQEQELLLNENIEKIQEAQQLLEEKDERQRSEIAQLVSDNEAKVMMLKMREEINSAVINASENGIFVCNKRGEISIANDKFKRILNIGSGDSINALTLIGSSEESVDQVYQEYVGAGKNIYYTVNDEELPLRLKIVESKTDSQSAYIGFVADLREKNKTEGEKDTLLSEALAREFEYKAQIEQLEARIKGEGADNSETEVSMDLQSGDFKLVWSDEYSVGYPAIDDQHKKLIAIINDLYVAFKNGQAFIKLQKILNELKDYTRVHFQYEEKLFSEHSYEHTQEHMSIHKVLLEKVVAFEEQFKSGNVTVALELIEFLKHWLIDHILGSDKQYAGKLGDGVVQENSSSVEERELKSIELSAQLQEVGITEIDNALRDCLDFVGILRDSYLKGADANKMKALGKEFIDLFHDFSEPVERVVVDGSYEYADAIVVEHETILECAQTIVACTEPIEDFAKLINELTDEISNYLTLGYGKFAEFVANTNQNIDSEGKEPALSGTSDMLLTSIEWNTKYEIGISGIDDQHKILVDLLSQLHAAFVENRTRKQIKTLLKGATDYTDYHFGVEERNFETISYEDKASHKAKHQTLISDIKAIQTAYNDKEQNVDFAQRVIEFATNLLQHFQDDDTRFVQPFRDNGIN